MHATTPRSSHRHMLRALLLTAALAAAPAALAGPPLLCHPFDTGGAASLPWGNGWNASHGEYDASARLVADVQALLAPGTPVIARMETLRRAAIYASRDGAMLRALNARLVARVASAADPDARAHALFDAGYFAETLQDVERLQRYDMPGIGEVDAAALRSVVARGDGSARIARALELRPDDASMRFAASLVARADKRPLSMLLHHRAARAGADQDALLARNLAKED